MWRPDYFRKTGRASSPRPVSSARHELRNQVIAPYGPRSAFSPPLAVPSITKSIVCSDPRFSLDEEGGVADQALGVDGAQAHIHGPDIDLHDFPITVPAVDLLLDAYHNKFDAADAAHTMALVEFIIHYCECRLIRLAANGKETLDLRNRFAKKSDTGLCGLRPCGQSKSKERDGKGEHCLQKVQADHCEPFFQRVATMLRGRVTF